MMMNFSHPCKTHLFLHLLLTGFILAKCTPQHKSGGGEIAGIPYPEPTPDSVATDFLPGIVSADSLDFNAAFSPDGNSFFFSRSRHGKWVILVSVYTGNHWTFPVPAPFSESQYSQADATFGPDGSLYYISNRPRNATDTTPDFDIWVVRQLEGGSWSTPENVEGVNSDSAEYYVSLSANGNLYFASSRTGGYGDHDIYVSRFDAGRYSTPENLGPAINGPQMEHDPCISGNEEVLYFTSVDRKDGYGSGDIYFSRRQPDRGWSAGQNAGPRINTPTYEYCTYITPDQKYFFFSSDYDVKWIDARYLPDKE
jgi:hypothetical protein